MNRKWISRFFSGAIIILVALLFVSQEVRSATEAIEYNLEAIVPLTGNVAILGVPVKNGLELAQDEWRERLSKEKVSINLNFGDSQANPKNAVTIYNQSKALRKVNAVYAYLGGITLALRPLTETDNVLLIAGTGDDSVCDGAKNIIRPYYSFRAEGEAMLEVISEKAPKKVGLIHSSDSATVYEVEKVIVPGLQKMNIIPIVQPYQPGNRDYRTQVLAVKKAAPEIVLTWGFASDHPFLISTLREQRVKSMIIGSFAISHLVASNRVTTPLYGMYYMGPSFLHRTYEEQNPQFKAFKTKYIKRYGAEQFHEAAVDAYDAYSLTAQALLAVRTTDAVALRSEILKGGFSALAGKYIFDEAGSAKTPIAFSHITETGDSGILRVFSAE